MALVTWNERYATGVNEIDLQHKRLFGYVNELFDAMRQGNGAEIVGKTLQGLQGYVNTHFRQEEAKMQEAGYPDLAAHQKVHRDLEGQLHQLVDKHRAGTLGTAMETSRFLSDWLQKHILETDMKYVPWVNGQRKAA